MIVPVLCFNLPYSFDFELPGATHRHQLSRISKRAPSAQHGETAVYIV